MPRCREAKIAARQFLSLKCLANTLTAGGNVERGKCPLLWGEAIWEVFEETIWVRVNASQKLPRDNGESVFAARHQDVSQGPLGKQVGKVKGT